MLVASGSEVLESGNQEGGRWRASEWHRGAGPFVLGGLFVSGLRAYEVFAFICGNYMTESGWGRGTGLLWMRQARTRQLNAGMLSINLRAVLLISN